MKLYPYLLILLILAGNASAECKEKECMTTEYKFQQDEGTWHTFYYNEVFNIGTNWYIIFDYPSGKNDDNISFEFATGLSKVHVYDPDKGTDSISFPGSSFTEEIFNLELYVNITGPDGSDGEFVLNIHVNKPPADDMLYLWGGMTVFWVAIGSYVLYLSNKLNELNSKVEKK
uniref:Uncharacterized protein n=1 Tax=uncultured marine group II/III euryarchaeote KM3_60_A11 TaxID=1456469 RepID=A0A075HB35_9EURY|nr:hypothetical protein [uncultured marine group II/III euryarchaeote KM3_60_A11]